MIPRRGLVGAADHHGPPKVDFWKDLMSPSKWKEEYCVIVSLSGWVLLFFGGYKFFTGGKKNNEKLPIEIGKQLARKHFIRHVFGESEFEDGNHFYRLLEHEPFSPKCYNFRGSVNDSEPKNAAVVNHPIEIGKQLARKHFIRHVFGESEFEDGNDFYRLLEHEPFIPKCYNFRGSVNDSEPKNAAVVNQRLARIMSAILESYASDEDAIFIMLASETVKN
ncbi:glutaredoxin-related family [Olea europaea subsp. europaea]|uniref:Glutaredoxin-related family n=1 Tax=Olea europaea subsp. europaea TaxID=158383 RepID=A0A8S0PXE2_OLEEU|nr:glutaredoxin-related family [Olea europaea subsp. europaea]